MTQLKVMFVLLLLCFVTTINSQLTFTPTWGKRDPGASLTGGGSGGNGGGPQMVGSAMYNTGSENNCKTSMDSMLMIYRLIQTEAQRIMTCNGK